MVNKIKKTSKNSKKALKKSLKIKKILMIVSILVVAVLLLYFIVFWLVQPPKPGQFYNTPVDLPAKPGVLLRSETTKTSMENADAYKVLYSSRDINNLPIAVSGMALFPKTPPPKNGFPVVAWAHGTSGIARQCALSLTYESDTEFFEGARKLIEEGYAVFATDYPGLGTEGPHPYLIGKSEAYAILDGVRMISKHASWNADSRFALWGHSQGGHAVLFASQYSREYTPELDLVGTAAVAPATELKNLLKDDISTLVGKVFGSYALKSWSEVFPEARLGKIIKSEDLPLAETIAADCLGTKNEALIVLPEIKLMSDDFITHDLTEIEPWATIIRDNTVRPGGINKPIVLLQGSEDPVINPAVSSDWARRTCQSNNSLEYREYRGKDHLSVFPASISYVQSWIGERFSNQAPPSNCSKF